MFFLHSRSHSIHAASWEAGSVSQMRKAEIQESEKGTQAFTCDQWRDWGLNVSPRPHPTPLQLCDHTGHME